MATTTKDLVLAALRDGGPATVKELMKRTDKGETAVRDALKALRDSGEAFKDGPVWEAFNTDSEAPANPVDTGKDDPVDDTPAKPKKARSTPGELSARDAKVLNAIGRMVQEDPDTDLAVRDVAKAVGAEDIRAEDGWSPTTYMSLRRLRQTGHVKRVTRWVI